MLAFMKSIKVTPEKYDRTDTVIQKKMAVVQFEIPMDEKDQSTGVYVMQELLSADPIELVVTLLQLKFQEEGGEENEGEAETDSTESNGRHAGDVSESEAHPIG